MTFSSNPSLTYRPLAATFSFLRHRLTLLNALGRWIRHSFLISRYASALAASLYLNSGRWISVNPLSFQNSLASTSAGGSVVTMYAILRLAPSAWRCSKTNPPTCCLSKSGWTSSCQIARAIPRYGHDGPYKVVDGKF